MLVVRASALILLIIGDVYSEDKSIASAAFSAIARLTGDKTQILPILEFLKSDSVNVRRACIQDLMDVEYYEAIGKESVINDKDLFRKQFNY